MWAMMPMLRVLSRGYSRATERTPCGMGKGGKREVGAPDARNPLWPSFPPLWEGAAIAAGPERVSGYCAMLRRVTRSLCRLGHLFFRVSWALVRFPRYHR